MPDIEHWLAPLPWDNDAIHQSNQGIRFSAFLVSAPAERVRFVVWPLVLEFNAIDVIDIEELAIPEEARLSKAIAVDVLLRIGAPLVVLYSAEMLPVRELGASIPFSTAIRPISATLPHSPQYVAAQEDYFRRHGLDLGS